MRRVKDSVSVYEEHVRFRLHGPQSGEERGHLTECKITGDVWEVDIQLDNGLFHRLKGFRVQEYRRRICMINVVGRVNSRQDTRLLQDIAEDNPSRPLMLGTPEDSEWMRGLEIGEGEILWPQYTRMGQRDPFARQDGP